MIKHIWEGVYDSFSDVPDSREVFNGETWVTHSRAKILELLEAAKKPETVPTVVAYHNSLLPLLAALVAHKSEPIRILDFGGSLGFTYVPVMAGMAKPESVEYHIVETEAICRVGTEVFKNDGQIHFHSSLPKMLLKVDIVYMGSSLHYIEDWRKVIHNLTDYQPGYFLFTDLPAGDIPTYVTTQNYYGMKVPVWFFNINEILDYMSSLTFKLLLKSTYTASILGQEQELPQDNFSAELRLGHTCSLLFGRGST